MQVQAWGRGAAQDWSSLPFHHLLWSQEIHPDTLTYKRMVKNSPVVGWSGLHKKSNVKISKYQKNVQNWQYKCIIHQLSKSQTAGLWMRLMISITNAWLHWVHKCVGGKVSTDHKSSHNIKISQLVQYLIYFSDLTWPHLSTHLSTH